MKSEKTYRTLQLELEAVMERIESASYDDLDELLVDFEQAKNILDVLESKLTHAKNTIIQEQKP